MPSGRGWGGLSVPFRTSWLRESGRLSGFECVYFERQGGFWRFVGRRTIGYSGIFQKALIADLRRMLTLGDTL